MNWRRKHALQQARLDFLSTNGGRMPPNPFQNAAQAHIYEKAYGAMVLVKNRLEGLFGRYTIGKSRKRYYCSPLEKVIQE